MSPVLRGDQFYIDEQTDDREVIPMCQPAYKDNTSDNQIFP